MKENDQHRVRWITGDWTDDSDQMILMIDSILENDGKVYFKLCALKHLFSYFNLSSYSNYRKFWTLLISRLKLVITLENWCCGCKRVFLS